MVVPRRFRTLPIRINGSMGSGIRWPRITTSLTAASVALSWPTVQFEAALPAFLPDAIDFAFLKDLGMTITEETDRPETYGLAGWTDYAAFTVSVSRQLQIALADPQPHYGYGGGSWKTLDVVDLLQAEVDAFGYLSTRNFRSSHVAKGLDGTVRYAGGLLGAALDRAGLPPVTGDTSLAVDLTTLSGAASFTSLTVYPDGTPEPFANGSLHYPIELSANTIVGTGSHSTLRADFYGPRHDDVTGVLHDPRAGLLASFGAMLDERPSREDVIASADYLVGLSRLINTPEPVDEGWSHYRCGVGAACEMRHNPTGPVGWSDWMATTRENVLASTAGWTLRNAARPEADYDYVLLERLTSASTDGARGRHVIDGYTGTMEHVAFGTGFERYSDWTTEPDVISPDFEHRWTGVQGTASGGLPGGRARWSGPMLGYQYNLASSENRLVEGRATVDFWLSTSLVDVGFSEVASRDGLRVLPDFGFEGLQSETNGTFARSDESGRLYGAFFGPAHEEAGGTFHHYEMDIFGSFGARREADTVTLKETGTTRALVSRSGGYDFYAYDQWGFWGKQFQENIFGAFLEQNVTTVGNTSTYHRPYGRIEGTPSGQNPVSGSAVWSGKVRAFETEPRGYMPVSGNARLEVDFGDATVDVDFTDFEAGHNDMSWRALRVEEGAFRDPQVGQATIEGAFYGTEHQGVAGKFDRDSLRGVFGALRDESITDFVTPEEFSIDVLQYLTDPVEQDRSPGLLAAVIDEEGVKGIATSGVRRQGSPEKLTVNDLFHIGSNTKAMTSTMLATLVVDGTFAGGWSTMIADIFPELLGEIHKDYHSVDLSQLVRMKGGVARDAADWWAHRSNPDIIERRYTLLRENLRSPPAGPVGEFLYSNLGYMIAGAMAEKLTGKSWEILMKKRLFTPLGMTTAGFGAPGSPGAVDQPWGHRRDENGEWAPRQFDNASALGPAGTVHLSIEDWAKFIALWFPDEPPVILDRSTLNELITPDSGTYAAGWGVSRGRRGRKVLNHNGSNNYWYTHLNIYPHNGQAYIAATNSRDDDDTGSLLNSIIESLEEFSELSLRESLHVAQTQAPIVNLGDTLHVGANVAPPADQLAAGVNYNGVTVSSGQVQDGVGADRVLEYLKSHVSGGTSVSGIVGLPTFHDRPIIRLAEGTSDEFAEYVVRAVQLINTALPYEKRILFSTDPAPPLTAIEDVPDGQIFVDFTPSVEDWNTPNRNSPRGSVAIGWYQSNNKFNTTAQRREHKNMWAGHVWANSEAILNTAWVLNPDTGQFEVKLLENPVAETDTVRKAYSEENIVSRTARILIFLLGFVENVRSSSVPEFDYARSNSSY